MDERDDRRTAAADGWRGQGARRDALRGGPPDPRRAARAARARHGGARPHRLDRQRRGGGDARRRGSAGRRGPAGVAGRARPRGGAARARGGRVRRPARRDGRGRKRGGRDRRRRRGYRRARAARRGDRPPGRDGAGRTARAHDRARPRRSRRRRGPRRRRRLGRRRARGGPLRQRRRPPADGARRRRGGDRRGGRHALGPDAHAVGLPGLPRAPSGHRVARLRRHGGRQQLHPGRIRHAQEPRRPARRAARSRARPTHAARRRVRRQAPPRRVGGASGGKLRLPEPLAAAAAVKLKRPVRVAFTRMEDFAASNPAPGELIDVEVGMSRDGDFRAIRARVVCDRGMNEEFGVEAISSLLAAGPYRWPAYELRGYGVMTNRVGSGAYRGPGAPPAAFALETLLDELASELGLDPIELRLRNALVEGDRGIDGQPFPVFGAKECLERVRDHELWRRRGELPDGEGVGVAIGYWPGGLEPAAAACRLDADGGLTIITGAVDMTGTETTFAAIAAEAFGLPPERVRVTAGDTASTPFAGLSGGSKVTYTVGRAVQRAADDARRKLLEVAARELEIAPEDLEIEDGSVRPIGAPSRGLSVEDLAQKVLTFGSPHAPVEGYAGVAQTSRAPSAAAHLSHVRVDRETGAVTVVRHVIAQDVGRVLNPALVEGQLLGGTAQGLGWALFEELAHDELGQLRTGSFVDYAIPAAGSVPPIELEIVEVPAPDGPFGAKGIGEAPVIATAAAVANAIAAAVGVRLRELPMTPGRVWAALNDGG